MTSIYGPIVTGDDVEAAAKTTIGLWIPAYVDEVARQKGATLPPVRHYGVTYPDPGDTGSQYPSLAIYSPGITGEPIRHGDGRQDATWALGVGVVVADTVNYKALRLAKLYGAALRALLVQKGSLGGFATSTQWVDEETTSLGYELDRWIADCTLMFEVRVNAVVNRFGGPTTPPPDPTVPIVEGTVQSTHTTLTRTP